MTTAGRHVLLGLLLSILTVAVIVRGAMPVVGDAAMAEAEVWPPSTDVPTPVRVTARVCWWGLVRGVAASASA